VRGLKVKDLREIINYSILPLSFNGKYLKVALPTTSPIGTNPS
jgi:hypothetical protein